MFDFKAELAKYKPIRTTDELEDAVRDEITDIMDMLQYISAKVTMGSAEAPVQELEHETEPEHEDAEL